MSEAPRKQTRGFAALDPQRQREIAALADEPPIRAGTRMNSIRRKRGRLGRSATKPRRLMGRNSQQFRECGGAVALRRLSLTKINNAA